MLRQRKLRVTALIAVALVAAAAGLAAQLTGVTNPLELTTVDARFHVRGTGPQPKDIAVVAIDATTFNDLRDAGKPVQWPFPRRLHARVIDRLRRDGATVIAYDVQFTEETNRTDDYALVASVERNRPVVLSTTEVAPDGSTAVLGGDDKVASVHARVGNTALSADGRGVNRTVPYAVDGLESFAVATNEALTGRRVSDRRFALKHDAAWIDFAGPPGSMLTVPFSQVLAGTFKKGTFRGRVVVVGASAPSLQDTHPTSTTTGRALMAGAELQANAIETVRRGLPLQSTPGWVGSVLIALLAALMPLVAIKTRFLVALGAAAVAALLYLAAAQLVFGGGWVVPVVTPLLALMLAALGTSAAHALLSAAERMRTRDLFARFVPQAVVDDVLARTDGDLRLGGQRREGTVMFCDLRGFTTFSENIPPDRVIDVLNQYFTEMTGAIMDHGGTLVAYLGDGILAVFGAPIEQLDHAQRAVEAAREMVFVRLARLNAALAEQGVDHAFRMGVGLHSGFVVSGNVGSPQRIEYAAIGDTTNTASRVEGMTKAEGEQLLLSGATVDLLGTEHARRGLRLVGERSVRGRGQTITLWSVDDLDDAERNTAEPA